MYNRLFDLISEDKTKEVITILRSEISQKEFDIYGDILLLSARFSKWKKDSPSQNTTTEMLNKEYINIQKSLIALIGKLQKNTPSVENDIKNLKQERKELFLTEQRQIENEKNEVVKWLKKEVKFLSTKITKDLQLEYPSIKSFEEDFRFELWNAILLLSGALRLKDLGKLDNPKTVFEETNIDNTFYIKALDNLALLMPGPQFISRKSRKQAELYLNYFKDRISKYCL